MILKVIIENL